MILRVHLTTWKQILFWWRFLYQTGASCVSFLTDQQAFVFGGSHIQATWAFPKRQQTALSRMIMLTRLLSQCLSNCSFCLHGACVDSPYAIDLRKLTRLRVSLVQASYNTTPSTHIKGRFWNMLTLSFAGFFVERVPLRNDLRES